MNNKITQEDFNAMPVVNGVKICPSGDYSAIKSFPERCSFGESCSFGERCSFGEWCRFENKGKSISGTPFLSVSGFGSRINSKLYLWVLDTGLFVRAGCFLGTVEQFKEVCNKKDEFYSEAIDLLVKKAKTFYPSEQ